MSRLADILTAFYTTVDNMTVANGYGWDYLRDESQGTHATIGSSTAPRISVKIERAERLTGSSGGAFDETFKAQRFTLILRVPMGVVTTQSDVPYYSELAIANAIADVETAFDVHGMDATLCSVDGVREWFYEGYSIQTLTNEKKHHSKVVEFDFVVHFGELLRRR